jgi:hypothetical protein
MADVSIDSVIAALEHLPAAVIDEAGPELSAALRKVLEDAIKTERAPSTGIPWAPRKVGTGPMLQGAPLVLGVAMVGRTVWCRVKGVEARHSRGWVRGGTARPVMFEKTLPPEAIASLTAVINRRVQTALTPTEGV